LKFKQFRVLNLLRVYAMLRLIPKYSYYSDLVDRNGNCLTKTPEV